MNRIIPSPNYIPVKSKADFDIDVIIYYNQYYATEKETQQRRIMRNYLSNQETIKKSNQNPFINNAGKKFNFLYTYAQNYMIVTDTIKNTVTVYIRINNSWCTLRHMKNNLASCIEIGKIIKNNIER